MAGESDTTVDYGVLAGCACAMCAAARAPSADPQSQAATAGSQDGDTSTNDADQGVDAVLSGLIWTTSDLTFSFPDSPDDYSYDIYGEAANGFSPFDGTQKAVVREALGQYAAVSGLTFTEISGAADRDADIAIAESERPPTAWAYFPSSSDWGGDVWFNPTDYNTPKPGNYAWATILHELGHALGLKHGHEDPGFGPGAIPAGLDSHEYSLMTYRSYVGAAGEFYTNGVWGGPQTLMMLDIAAIQRMYGANFGHESGDTVYSVSPATGRLFIDGVGQTAPGANFVLRTIWDGGGVDTYDFSNYATDLAIDLAPGGHVDLDVGGVAQRAYLGGGVHARGHVFNALQISGDARSLIENAVGGAGDDLLSGNAADNDLSGGAGRDTLQGLAGDDTLTGGAAADLFIFDRTAAESGDADMFADLDFAEGDAFTLAGFFGDFAGGAAQIRSYGELFALSEYSFAEISALEAGGALLALTDGAWSATVTLFEIAFDLILDDGSEIGFDETTLQPVAGAATEFADVMEGGDGDDAYAGLGGADTMRGGRGDDTLDGGSGRDELHGGAGADSLTGGDQRDLLIGEAGDDTLEGGRGRDRLYGGGGDDRLSGDGYADMLEGGGGRDALLGRHGDDRLVGGRGADTLKGGVMDDVLLGGRGADELRGGGGDDRLLGHHGGDRLFGHAGRDSLNGGGGDDTLAGGGGADMVLGGAGDDLLLGGGGSDVFRFRAGDGQDTIADWRDGVDLLRFAGVRGIGELDMMQLGDDVIILSGGGRVLIETAIVEEFDAADFIF